MTIPNVSNIIGYDKLIVVHFYTSSVEKFLQARTVFGRLGYSIRHYRGMAEPYDEDYELGTRGLLQKAIGQIENSFGLKSVFFVEDTSVYIEALSSDGREYPGLSVKEWFGDISFEELDKQLKVRNNNRRAIVRSDIALHIPGLSRPIYFRGETCGTVANSPPDFAPSTQYPWLTPHTFNGWFKPEGANRTLGEMEFEESLKYDFRVKAFLQLYERLEELSASLNLPTYAYVRRHHLISQESQYPSLFSDNPVFCVIGPKCAGKSTFGDYVSQSVDTDWCEASRIFQTVVSEYGCEDPKLSALEFLRSNGLDLVARKMLSLLRTDGRSLPLITGLRTIEELYTLRTNITNIVVVHINADQRIRFEREIKRSRDERPKTFAEFQDYDEQQCQFGLFRISSDLADVTVENEGTLEEYHSKIDLVLRNFSDDSFRSRHRTSRREALDKSELVRTLAALSQLGKASTCKEISAETVKQGRSIRVYNTNRALKSVPEYAGRLKRGRNLLRYRVTDSGVQYLEYLRLHYGLNWGVD